MPLKRPRGSAWWGCSPLPARVDVAAASHITPRSVATCESVRHRRPDRARSRERPSIAVEGKGTLERLAIFFFLRAAPTADSTTTRRPRSRREPLWVPSHEKGSRSDRNVSRGSYRSHTRLTTRQEYVNGQLKNKYGDAFVRGNNVLYISAVKDK